MPEEKLNTHQKALNINLDKRWYGSFAEIGAGQEVVRWFFRVGGASGTVAKSMSAYDMAVSDAIYGTAERYVSRPRLQAMLNHEFALNIERLSDMRGDSTSFFAFANTVATRNFKGTNECHGWMGVKFQSHARDEASQVIIHVRMLDTDVQAQQEALGIVGVNLCYGCFFIHHEPEKLVESLLDDLHTGRLEIDMIEFNGIEFRTVDNRLMALKLVQLGLSGAAMFGPNRDVLQPAEVFYKKAVLVERGSFRPLTHVNLDMMRCAFEKFTAEPSVTGREVVQVMELTMRFKQIRTIDDLWFDSFVALPLARGVDLTTGVDWLYGRGAQQSYNFAYVAALDGSSVAAGSSAYHVDEVNGLRNTRNFGGLYTQLDWAPTDAITVLAGVRLNHTQEQQDSGHVDTLDATASFAGSDSRTATRLSGAGGITVRLWGERGSGDEGRLFVDYRNTFKPAAIDFGPDVNVAILTPEQADGFEAGLRGHAFRGQLEWEVAAFSLDFANVVVHTVDALGGPVLANAGTERFKGVEAELRWHLGGDLLLNGAFSYHDARFGYTRETEDGVLVELKGRQLDMSPHDMGSFAVLYAPATGLQASAQLAYIGRRFLDRLNTAPVGGYATVDASLGYRVGSYTLSLTARNLTDRRVPVSDSEFGDQSFYLLPARQIEAAFAVHLH